VICYYLLPVAGFCRLGTSLASSASPFEFILIILTSALTARFFCGRLPFYSNGFHW
jgi:hypothetical protein